MMRFGRRIRALGELIATVAVAACITLAMALGIGLGWHDNWKVFPILALLVLGMQCFGVLELVLVNVTEGPVSRKARYLAGGIWGLGNAALLVMFGPMIGVTAPAWATLANIGLWLPITVLVVAVLLPPTGAAILYISCGSSRAGKGIES